MAEPLSAAEALRAWSESDMRPLDEFGPWETVSEAIDAIVDESTSALRASLDPERPEAVEAWAAAYHHVACKFNGVASHSCRWRDAHRRTAAALLRARAEAKRP
jgi:hypothetical protein